MTEISEEAKALATAMNYGWPEQIQEFLDAHDKKLMEVANKMQTACMLLYESFDNSFPKKNIPALYERRKLAEEKYKHALEEFESFKKGKQP